MIAIGHPVVKFNRIRGLERVTNYISMYIDTSYSSVKIGDRFEVREFICKMLKAIANHIIQKYSDKVWNTRRYSIHQNSYLNR